MRYSITLQRILTTILLSVLLINCCAAQMRSTRNARKLNAKLVPQVVNTNKEYIMLCHKNKKYGLGWWGDVDLHLRPRPVTITDGTREKLRFQRLDKGIYSIRKAKGGTMKYISAKRVNGRIRLRYDKGPVNQFCRWKVTSYKENNQQVITLESVAFPHHFITITKIRQNEALRASISSNKSIQKFILKPF